MIIFIINKKLINIFFFLKYFRMERGKRNRLLKKAAKKIRKKEIVDFLINFCINKTEMSKEIYHSVNDEKWTLVDMFIIQFLSYKCDGSGFTNVCEVFKYLIENKQDLIDLKLLSKEGYNNSGYPLWINFDFDNNGYSEEMYNHIMDILVGNIESNESVCSCCN